MSFSDLEYEYNQETNTMFFPKGKITGEINQKQINTDILLVSSNLNLSEDIEFKAQESASDGFLLSYNIKGSGNYISDNTDLNLQTNNNTSKVLLVKNLSNTAKIKKGKLETISLTLEKDFLLNNMPNGKNKDALLSEFENKVCSKVLSSTNISSQKSSLLNLISNSQYQGEMQNIFMQSKIFELIFIEFKDLFTQEKKDNKIKLDSYDIKAINDAKDILLNNIQNPPSIAELAKLVRLNEFKLKVGFKKVYNASPHNLLLNHRLEIAKQLLIKGEMNINEISNYVGYKYTQNFTTAFSKKYNILPKELIKKREYYY